MITLQQHLDNILLSKQVKNLEKVRTQIQSENDIENLRPLYMSLYYALVAEMSVTNGREVDENLAKIYMQAKQDMEVSKNINEIKHLATFIFDALIIEKFKNYAYEFAKSNEKIDSISLADQLHMEYIRKLELEDIYN